MTEGPSARAHSARNRPAAVWPVLLGLASLKAALHLAAATVDWGPGIAGAPFALPILTPQRYIAYQRSWGLAPPKQHVEEAGLIPLHLAVRLHGRAVFDSVSRVYLPKSAIGSASSRARAIRLQL